MTTRKTRASGPLLNFSSDAEAGRLQYTGASPEKRHPHAHTKGFCVFVSKPSDGKPSQRWYGVRYRDVRDGVSKDIPKKLGLVAEMRYSDAEDEAKATLKRARTARATGAASMPTLVEAFEAYLKFKTTRVAKVKQLKPSTVLDYRSRFKDLVPVQWHNRTLDELTAKVWTDLRHDSTTNSSYDVRGRAPVSESRFDGLLRGVVSGMYRMQLEDEHPTLINPVPLMRRKAVLSTPNAKSDFIAAEKLPEVWQFLQTETRAPQRDITTTGLLTGWRRQLICRIPLDRIDVGLRAVEWRETDPGGPYHEPDAPTFRYPLSDWLWERVFAPRLAMAKRGQKYLIESGRRPGKPYGDIRDSLEKLDPIAGIHVHPHVLRRSFAVHALAANVPGRTIEQLMMHKASTMTTKYQPRDFAAMKAGANQYAAWFTATVGLSIPAAAPAAQPVIEGLTPEKVATLQQLASMPAATLEMLMKFASAMK